uniref:Guanylate cyclase activator 1C n=1 Tax=Neogobius melanostomus TaxID=47308 RepID=A0A8C6U523_9GOBI
MGGYSSSLDDILEEDIYVDQVFFTFDMDGDGYIDFVEYIAAISLLLKGEVNQKLKWYFKLFDQDGNGKIDKDEMETIFKVQRIFLERPQITALIKREIVNLIYERVDVHGEGELTLEEFISGAKEHDDIMEMLGKMMDLTHVLQIIINGQKRTSSGSGQLKGETDAAWTKFITS